MTVHHEPFDPAPIRAVGFDGYGTLFAYDLNDFRREVAIILAEQGIETDLDVFFQTWTKSYTAGGVWGMDGPSRERPEDDRVMNGPLPAWHSQWESWRRQFAAAFEAHGLRGNAEIAATHLREALTNAPPYPDAHETIEALARRGYTLGLLSNADEDFLQGALSSARLRFSVIQSSESLRAYKPHRATYEELCGRLGFPARQVLYVGDSPIADVVGARNAGLRTAMVVRPSAANESSGGYEYPESLMPPDLTLASLTELLDVLPGLGHAEGAR